MPKTKSKKKRNGDGSAHPAGRSPADRTWKVLSSSGTRMLKNLGSWDAIEGQCGSVLSALANLLERHDLLGGGAQSKPGSRAPGAGRTDLLASFGASGGSACQALQGLHAVAIEKELGNMATLVGMLAEVVDEMQALSDDVLETSSAAAAAELHGSGSSDSSGAGREGAARSLADFAQGVDDLRRMHADELWRKRSLLESLAPAGLGAAVSHDALLVTVRGLQEIWPASSSHSAVDHRHVRELVARFPSSGG